MEKISLKLCREETSASEILPSLKKIIFGAQRSLFSLIFQRSKNQFSRTSQIDGVALEFHKEIITQSERRWKDLIEVG